MSPDTPAIAVRTDGDVHHATLLDRAILDDDRIQEIVAGLVALIDAGERPKIVLDFGSVEQVSSTLLGALITVHNRIRTKQGQLRLSSLAPRIRDLFQVTKLESLFDIYASPAEAAASIR